jgi:hypothetical protein
MPRRSWPHGAAASRTRGRPPAVWPVSDQRRQLLRAALGFAGLPRPSYDRALWSLRTWLDSWAGIGAIVTGMARQGYDLQLTRYDARLAGDLRHDRDGALDHERHGLSVGTHAVARGPRGGAGRAEESGVTRWRLRPLRVPLHIP